MLLVLCGIKCYDVLKHWYKMFISLKIPNISGQVPSLIVVMLVYKAEAFCLDCDAVYQSTL